MSKRQKIAPYPCLHRVKRVMYTVEYGNIVESVCPKCLPKYKRWYTDLRITHRTVVP